MIIRCPACLENFELDDDYIMDGFKGQCPECKTPFIVNIDVEFLPED